MPQLTQLPYVFWSQLFWLAVTFGITFLVIGLGMVPKIQGTVDLRERKIADDLERAQSARAGADETEAAWRLRMDTARAEAAKLSNDAKQASARETETVFGRVGSVAATSSHRRPVLGSAFTLARTTKPARPSAALRLCATGASRPPGMLRTVTVAPRTR